jgi:hypothetical protein
MTMSSNTFAPQTEQSKWRARTWGWFATKAESFGRLGREDPPARPAGVARLYLPDGGIEYVCMSCLDLICTVRNPEDAVLPQHDHRCASQVSPVELTGKVV